MSTPSPLSGEPKGRNSSGTASTTLSAAGKAMTRDSSTAPLAEVVALQGSVTLGEVAIGGAVRVHNPALAAVASAAPQHLQDAQPGATSAEEAQQQPPRHKLVPQSTLLLQASPGYRHTHAPLPSAQLLQPSCTAKGEQQAPPLQEPEAHAEPKAQGAPGDAKGVGEGEGGGAEETGEWVAVADGEGVPVRVPVDVVEMEGVAVSVAVLVADAAGVEVSVAVKEVETEGVAVGVLLEDSVGDTLSVPVGVAEKEGVAVSVVVLVVESVGAAVRVLVVEMEGVAVSVVVLEIDIVGVAVGVLVGVGVAVWVVEGVAVRVVVLVRDFVGVDDGEQLAAL